MMFNNVFDDPMMFTLIHYTHKWYIDCHTVQLITAVSVSCKQFSHAKLRYKR